jgi:hypothetical protein
MDGASTNGGAGGSTVTMDAAQDAPGVQPDAAGDASIQALDAPTQTLDAAIDAGVIYAQIKALLASRCAGCHTGTGSAASRLDLTDSPDAAMPLYQRLLGPLMLETYCGEGVDAGIDAGLARHAIVPDDPASSFLYLKITGTQPSPGTPPANCGVRMPRVSFPAVDGGAGTMPSCDTLDGGAAANCLSQATIDMVHQWILEGAPQ